MSEFVPPKYDGRPAQTRTCTMCGARVDDTEQHTAWHRALWEVIALVSENVETLAHVLRRA